MTAPWRDCLKSLHKSQLVCLIDLRITPTSLWADLQIPGRPPPLPSTSRCCPPSHDLGHLTHITTTIQSSSAAFKQILLLSPLSSPSSITKRGLVHRHYSSSGGYHPRGSAAGTRTHVLPPREETNRSKPMTRLRITSKQPWGGRHSIPGVRRSPAFNPVWSKPTQIIHYLDVDASSPDSLF